MFDEPAEEVTNSKDIFTVEQKVKIPIEQLEFLYGSIAFKFIVQEMKTEIEFEIENLEVRPEFEVLKSYFVKSIKSKNVKVDIHAEFEDGKLISQIATSADIEKINQQVIEAAKFRFVSIKILGQLPKTSENLLTVNEVQNKEEQLYTDGQELLDDILKNKNYRHSKHLRYLANKHEGSLMKIRFVLNPFSFVLLLAGENQLHIILETLDTEEATYLWHVEKSKESLIKKVKEIDQQLNLIRNNGRQIFLETNPNNFSKILHDYSDERKGFIIWKDLIEEQIV
ncbi:MAG: hypothetical protein ACR2KX_19405 [Chitinophagaceae bacterium]